MLKDEILDVLLRRKKSAAFKWTSLKYDNQTLRWTTNDIGQKMGQDRL